MKIVYICMLGAGLLLLLFFTLFGKRLYEINKPVVTTLTASSVTGREGIVIYSSALYYDGDDTYVYLLLSEQGYSRYIYTVSRVSVNVIQTNELSYTAVIAEGDVRIGDRVVNGSEGQLENGIRVILR